MGVQSLLHSRRSLQLHLSGRRGINGGISTADCLVRRSAIGIRAFSDYRNITFGNGFFQSLASVRRRTWVLVRTWALVLTLSLVLRLHRLHCTLANEHRQLIRLQIE